MRLNVAVLSVHIANIIASSPGCTGLWLRHNTSALLSQSHLYVEVQAGIAHSVIYMFGFITSAFQYKYHSVVIVLLTLCYNILDVLILCPMVILSLEQLFEVRNLTIAAQSSTEQNKRK